MRMYSTMLGYPPSAQEIAEGIGISRPSVHRLLDRMEEDGLIERTRTPLGFQSPRGIRLVHGVARTEEL